MYLTREKLNDVRSRLAQLEKNLSPLNEFYLYQIKPARDLETMLSSDPDFKEWGSLKLVEAELERRCKEAGLEVVG
jgi:hypothetical protein